MVQNVMENLNRNEKLWLWKLVYDLFLNVNHVLSLTQSFKGIFKNIFLYYVTMFLVLLHSVHWGINSPLKNSPLFFAKFTVKPASCPILILFRQFPFINWFFVNPHPKNQIFRWIPMMIKFVILNLISSFKSN